jgi:uncharacterized protein (TIGR02246 family)
MNGAKRCVRGGLGLLAVLAGASCQSGQKRSEAPLNTKPIEDTLRAIVQRTFQDIEAKNADGVLKPLSDDVIFVGDGLEVNGKDSLAKLTTRAFSAWHSVKADLKITKVNVLAPDIAVVNWQSHVAVTDTRGNVTPFGGIVTAVFVNKGGRWQIIQQQQCAPMPPEVPRNMDPTKAIPES